MTITPAIILEIILLAAAFYGFIRHMQVTRGGSLLAGFIVVLIVAGIALTVVAKDSLPHLEWIADAALPALALGLLVIFQQELRLALARIGSMKALRVLDRFFGGRSGDQGEKVAQAILSACERMARTRTGALIAVQRRHAIDGFGVSGVKIDAEVSVRLIETIFYKSTPLHDGAVLVIGGRIMYAACHLPSAHEDNPALGRDMGTRHRAALGLAEQEDALVVVVSEETGRLSYAVDGTMQAGVSLQELAGVLRAGIDAGLESASRGETVSMLPVESDDSVSESGIDADIPVVDEPVEARK